MCVSADNSFDAVHGVLVCVTANSSVGTVIGVLAGQRSRLALILRKR